MDARRSILARRARFVAAALAAIGCNESVPPVAAPMAATSDEPAAPPSPRAKPRPKRPSDASAEPIDVADDLGDDADRDGIPDALDACPRAPGTANPDPKKHGCPCLTIITP